MREQQHHHFELRINGDHTFLLNERLLCSFSGRLRRMTKQQQLEHQKEPALELDDFPGGPEAFELAARFCYNRGKIPMSPSNICLLHCAATSLEMTSELTPCNLLPQAETFLDGLFYWTWHDLLSSLRAFSSSPLLLLHSADSSGLLDRLASSLLAKISANSEIPITSPTPFHPSPSSFSSTEANNSLRPSVSSFPRTPEPNRATPSREWWFDDLTTLHPKVIEKITRMLGPDRRNLLLARFVLHYLARGHHRGECSALADTAVRGVLSMGKGVFSCRGLFRVLRVASSAGVSSGCREKLESLMGSLLDQATLDDLLVSAGHHHHNPETVYDVDLVLRLVKVFVVGGDGSLTSSSPTSLERVRKVGKLLDMYLSEVSPDQGLKASKFQSLAESLPDHARDCFDGVYRALDVYLQSHAGLTMEERARLCRCLNYEKLSVGARRDLAKNPRVPPRAAVRALLVPQKQQKQGPRWCGGVELPRAGVYRKGGSGEGEGEREEMRVKLERMQRRVVELERTCREMQGKMSKMGTSTNDHHHQQHHHHQHQQQQRVGRGLPRLC